VVKDLELNKSCPAVHRFAATAVAQGKGAGTSVMFPAKLKKSTICRKHHEALIQPTATSSSEQ